MSRLLRAIIVLLAGAMSATVAFLVVAAIFILLAALISGLQDDSPGIGAFALLMGWTVGPIVGLFAAAFTAYRLRTKAPPE